MSNVVNGQWKVVGSTAKRGEAVLKLEGLSGSEDATLVVKDTTLFSLLSVVQISVVEGRENLLITQYVLAESDKSLIGVTIRVAGVEEQKKVGKRQAYM